MSVVLDHDPSRIPDGGQIRRLTARIEGAREGRGLGAALAEFWYAVVTLALLVALVIGIAAGLRETVPAPEPGQAVLAGALPALLVVLAAAGGLVGLAGRLGPVGLGGGGAAWWLPMPVDRRGLLRPTVLTWPLLGAGVGAVVAPLALGIFDTPLTPAEVLAWAVAGAAAFGFLVALSALVQGLGGGRGRASGTVAVVGELVMLVAALVLGGLAVLGEAGLADEAIARRPTLPGPGLLLLVAVPLAVLGAAATFAAERRVGLLDGWRLRSQGSIGDRARAALLSLDLRELSRALVAGSTRARRRGSVRRVPVGASRVLVTADLLLLARSPRSIAQIVVATLLGVAASGVDLLRGGVPLAGVWVLTGFWAATSAAGGARHGDLVPALDRALPLSAAQVRLARGVVPLLAALLWALVVLGSEAVRTGDPVWWVLAPCWAAVLAAAALRSAYRPPPRWSAAVVSPMGGIPPTGGAFHGVDAALVATLPTTIALYLGGLTETLAVAQVVLAALGVAVVLQLTGRKPKSERTPPSTSARPTATR